MSVREPLGPEPALPDGITVPDDLESLTNLVYRECHEAFGVISDELNRLSSLSSSDFEQSFHTLPGRLVNQSVFLYRWTTKRELDATRIIVNNETTDAGGDLLIEIQDFIVLNGGKDGIGIMTSRAIRDRDTHELTIGDEMGPCLIKRHDRLEIYQGRAYDFDLPIPLSEAAFIDVLQQSSDAKYLAHILGRLGSVSQEDGIAMPYKKTS